MEPPIADTETIRIVRFVRVSDAAPCSDSKVLAEGIRRVDCLDSSAGCHSLFIVPLLCRDDNIRLPMVIMSPDGSLILKEDRFLFRGDGDVSSSITTGTAGEWTVGIIAGGEPGVDDALEQHWWYAYSRVKKAAVLDLLGIAYYSDAGMRGLSKVDFHPKQSVLNLTWECEYTGEPSNEISVVESYKVIDGKPAIRSKRLSGRFHLADPTQTFTSPSTASTLGATLSRGWVETSGLKAPRWWKLQQGPIGGWQLEENLGLPENWYMDGSGEIGCLNLSSTAGMPQ